MTRILESVVYYVIIPTVKSFHLALISLASNEILA